MPGDPRKRQKKQERRTAKRKTKHQELAREKGTGLPARLTAAAKHPVLYSWATEELWTHGLGQVCLSRALPDGTVAFAVFLVDRYCLGVKDAWLNIVGRFTYDSKVERDLRARYTVRALSPAAVRKLVEGAVNYAASFGLHPHPDYQRARLLFGDIDAGECPDEFEFGKDGKPLFISGPHDTPQRCQHIMNLLAQKVGMEGFHYLMPVGGGTEIIPEEMGFENPPLLESNAPGEDADEDEDEPEEQAP